MSLDIVILLELRIKKGWRVITRLPARFARMDFIVTEPKPPLSEESRQGAIASKGSPREERPGVSP